MAVLRNGRYQRKASDAEAERMQERQRMATLRKLRRRIDRAPDSGWRDWLLACQIDVMNAQERAA